MRANRGIPEDLEREAEKMTKGQFFLHRKGIWSQFGKTSMWCS
jgi:hypothetical protein